MPLDSRIADDFDFERPERASGGPTDAPGADLDPYFDEAGKRFNVDPDLLRAQASVESKFDRYAVSPTSALGVMQVEPDTYTGLRKQYPDIGPNPFNPRDNIMAGAAYLRQMQDAYGPSGGLAAYNAGPGRYEAHLAGTTPLPDETNRYVNSVVDGYAAQKSAPSPKENAAASTSPTMPNGWTVTPVDHDPFAAPAKNGAASLPKGWSVTPVDGDPFAEPAPTRRAPLSSLPVAPVDTGNPAPYQPEGAAPPKGFISDPSVGLYNENAPPTPQTKSAAQLASVAQGAAGGLGSVVGAPGEVYRAQHASSALSVLGAMDAIDAGKTGSAPYALPGIGDAEAAQVEAYQNAAPADRAQMRASMNANVAAATQSNLATSAGEAITTAGQKAFPVAPENEGFATNVGRTIGALPVAVGAGIAGGMAAGPAGAIAAPLLVIGAQSYHGTREEAVKAGASQPDADKAASLSALTQMGIMALPIGSVIHAVPELASGLWRTLQGVAQHGAEFGGFNALATTADNYIAQKTYDPTRPLMQGVPEAAASGAVAGGLLGAGAHQVAPGLQTTEAHLRAAAAAFPGAEPPAPPAGLPGPPPEGPSPDSPPPTPPGRPMPTLDAMAAQARPPATPEAAANAETEPPTLAHQILTQPPVPPVIVPPAPPPPGEVAPIQVLDNIAKGRPPQTPPPVLAQPTPTPAPPAPPPVAPPPQQEQPAAPTTRYTMLKPSEIGTDPQTFQYKASDARGITGSLTGTNRWEPDLANPITAWQRNDGQIIAVNGHQRTDLAQRAEAAGQPDVQVPARVFSEADGYTPEYMRVLGAYQNIAEGTGTAMDAAKILRGKDAVPADMQLPALPPNQALVQQGRGLAGLSDDAFGMVQAGAVQPEHAALVGAMIRDPAQQISALQVLQKAEPPNAEQARLMVRDIAQSGFLQAAEAEQGDIFGMGGPPPPAMFAERAKVLANALKILRGNRAVFGAAIRGEDQLTGAGNVLSAQGNVAGKSENDRLIDRLNDDATRRGPLSDSLSAAARDIVAGKPLPAVTSHFLGQVRAIERGGSTASVPTGVDAGGGGYSEQAGVEKAPTNVENAQASGEGKSDVPASGRAGTVASGVAPVGEAARPTNPGTIEQIMAREKVGPKKAAEIQAAYLETIGRPITEEERGARLAGVKAPKIAPPRTIDIGGHALPLNHDGTVTLYATTTKAGAKRIISERVVRAGAQPSVYLSTSSEGSGAGGEVVAVRVDPRALQLERQFPDGRADFRADQKSLKVRFASLVDGGAEGDVARGLAGPEPETFPGARGNTGYDNDRVNQYTISVRPEGQDARLPQPPRKIGQSGDEAGSGNSEGVSPRDGERPGTLAQDGVVQSNDRNIGHEPDLANQPAEPIQHAGRDAGLPQSASTLLHRDHEVRIDQGAEDAQGIGSEGNAPPQDGLAQPIDAYHGTPHDFDAFDTAKIGTGEGAQAYGHGLYFAQNPGVARQYRDNLTNLGAGAELIHPEEGYRFTRSELKGDGGSEAFDALDKNNGNYERAASQPLSPDAQGKLDLWRHNGLVFKPSSGSTFTVRINAEPEEMLDWDKPLSQQSAKVREALDQLGVRGSDLWGDLTGAQAYHRLAGGDFGGKEEAASAALHAAGIKGIRYLDQGSRNAGDWRITPPGQTTAGDWMVKNGDPNSKGLHFATEAEARAALAEKQAQVTHNVVVFDHHDIEITHRNGEPVKPRAMTAPEADAMQTEQGLAQPRRPPLPSGPDLFGTVRQEPLARAPDPTIRNDARQAVIPGMEPSAVQAQAARDATPPRSGQAPANEGLFARPETTQPELTPRTSRWAVPQDRLHEAPHSTHEAAADWVFQQGRATGHEHIAVVDNATGAIVHAGTSGYSDFIDFSSADMEKAPDRAFTIHHNHPSGSAPSVQDLQMGLARGISDVVAVGHNGAVYIATATPKYRAIAADRGLVAAQKIIAERQNVAYNRAMAVIKPLLDTGKITRDQANLSFYDVVNRFLHANGTIDYVSNYKLPALVQAGFRHALTESGYAPDRAYRLAQPIRADQGLAGLPQPVGGQPAREGAGVGVADQAGQGGVGGFREEPGDVGDKLYSFPAALFDKDTWKHLSGPIVPAARAIAQWTGDFGKSIADSIAPMRAGSSRAQASTADFANTLRKIMYRFGEIDSEIEKAFTPRQREQMGRALDAQSVFEQQIRDLSPARQVAARADFNRGATGLAGLNPAQRSTDESLNLLSMDAWRRMQERGMVAPNAVGIPYFFPRQIVRWSEDAGFTHVGGRGEGGNRGIDQRGLNLTTAGPMRRKHLTPEETEEAARSVQGLDVSLLRDIRSLPQRLAFTNRAIAGVDLMNRIEQIGREVGVQLVVRGDIPGLLNPGDYFTMSDHPSFRQWAGNGWKAIHVAREFEGPLKAILTQRSPTWYRATQQIKGAGMNAIMWSPFIHLGVEAGRAAPLFIQHPVLTMKALVAAHNLRRNLDYMDMATQDGLAPLGHTGGWHTDPVSIADAASVDSRTGFLAALASVRDAMANGARKSPIAGQLLHDILQHPQKTLLWDNVFNLQIGLYDSLRHLWIKKGFSPEAAGTMAAHIANRYAGALPAEHLSRAANMAANLLLFSRSFTLGNLAVMKDMLTGAPPHILARLEQMIGSEKTYSPQGANNPFVHPLRYALDVAPPRLGGGQSSQAYLKRKALSAVLMDIGLFVIVSGLVQVGLQVLRNSGQQGLPAAARGAYNQWLEDASNAIANSKESPLEAFGVLPQHWNEPGKQGRVYAGNDSTGRGIYVSLPAGKVGAEFLGWGTNPAAMLINKSNWMVRPIWEVIFNTDSLGRQVYTPNPATLGDYASIAGDVIRHIPGDAGPTSLIQGAKELYQHATNPKSADHPYVSAAKILGPATGLGLISQGFPGGPAAGEIHAENARERFAQERAMPAVRDKITAGDIDGAVKDMEALDMKGWQIKYYIRQVLNPGMTPGAMKDLQTMSPRVQQRVRRDMAPSP